jgi:hypothetical protein
MANVALKKSAREWTALSGHQGGGSVITSVGGFDRYRESVPSLPLLEQIKLGLLANFIVESYRPGNNPIVEVEAIGHADRDFQRGAKFEREISEKRAVRVGDSLRDAVARLTPIQILVGPSPRSIRWLTTAVGASEPHPNNRAKKMPQHMTETDRKRNRRVEILMIYGPSAIPNTQSEVVRIFLTLLEAMAFGKPVPPVPPPKPSPRPPRLPPWFWDPKVRPEPRTPEYERLKREIEKALEHVDTDTVLNSISEIRDRLNTSKEEEKWLHDVLKGIEEDIKREREDAIE